MNEVATKYAREKVASVFVYTNEAHPAEHYRHLSSMEQKFRHAAALRDDLCISRPILLDSLDGACHRAYGSMPNMTWIFNRAGQAIYKSDWTDANSVDNALQYFVDIAKRRRDRETSGALQSRAPGLSKCRPYGVLQGSEAKWQASCG